MGTVPTPPTQTAGTSVPAATINGQGNLATYLAGRVESGGSRKPLCVMRQTVVQSVPNNTGTVILFDAEDVDYDNGHSTVTNTSRYTFQTQGWYDIQYHASFAANGAAINKCWLVVSGATAVPGSAKVITPNSGQASGFGGARRYFFNVTDYLEMNVLQNTGSALNTNVTAPEGGCYMSVTLVSI